MMPKLAFRMSTSGWMFKIFIVFLIMAMVFIFAEVKFNYGDVNMITTRSLSGQMKTND